MSSDLRPIRIIDLVLVKLEFPQHRRINRLEGRVQNSDAYLEFPQHRRTNRFGEQCYRIAMREDQKTMKGKNYYIGVWNLIDGYVISDD